MMTINWPRCLEERGVPLVLDASPPYPDARVYKTESLTRTESDSDGETKQPRNDGMGNGKDTGTIDVDNNKDENSNYQEPPTNDGSEEASKPDAVEQRENPSRASQASKASINSQTSNRSSRRISDTSQGKEYMDKTLVEYDAFSLAIAKLLVGDGTVRKLLTKGLGLRKIENAVLARSSWQRVPLLIDPNNKSLEMIRMLEKGNKVLEIDLGERY